MQGITLGYGGNPYGPAGTGKTESVKALGQALARQVCQQSLSTTLGELANIVVSPPRTELTAPVADAC